MAAELHMTIAAPIARPSIDKFANAALKATARFWFTVVIAGQLIFAFAVASFYSATAARGDLQAWNRFMTRGYVAER